MEATQRRTEHVVSIRKGGVPVRRERGSIIRKRKIKDNVMVQYLTQGLIAGVIQLLGDVVGQLFIYGRIESLLNPLLMGLYGFVSGLIVFKWYRVMEVFFKEGKRGGSKPSRLTPFFKMLADQLLASPLFTLFYLVFTGFVDSKPSSEILPFVRATFVDIQLKSYRIWPVVQMVNFYIVPLNLRVLVVNGASMMWNAYMRVYRHERGGK